MRFLIIFSFAFLISTGIQAQFWFGPKIGGQFTKHSYQAKDYSKQYDVDKDLNWHAGFALQYTTEQRFAVHTELIYQKVRNRVRNKVDTAVLDHRTDYTFLTTSMHGRFAFMEGVVSLYGLFGPRLSYWVNGSGSYVSQEASDNFGVPGGSYTVEFSDNLGGAGNQTLVVPRPNRLQYGLDVGIGTLIDLASGQRLAVEVKYGIGHSNMGFNDDLELVEGITYKPNIQFANDMVVFSVSYLFGYNPTDRRKGSSTNKLSNKKKK